MLKKILSYGFVEGLARGLNKLIVLGLPLFLGTYDFGIISILIAIEVVLPLISLLALEKAILRFYGEKNKYLGFKRTISFSVLFSHLLLAAILIVLYSLGVKSFFSLNIFPDLILVVILVFFQGKNLVTLNYLRVEGNDSGFFFGRLFTQITKLAFVILGVLILDSYIGYLIGSILAALLTYIVLKKRTHSFRKETFNKATFSTLMIFSWPLIFHSVAGNLLGSVDLFLIKKYLQFEDVGKYALAYSFGSMLSFAYAGITVYLEPLIYQQDDKIKRRYLLDNFLFYSLSAGVALYILLSLLSEYTLPYFYKQDFTESFHLIPLIALGHLLVPFYIISNYELIFQKKSLQVALLSTFSVFVNIILNILLIPRYGIFAAAATTLVAYFLQALIFNFAHYNGKYNYHLKDLIVFSFIILFLFFTNLEITIQAMVLVVFLYYQFHTKNIRYKVKNS